jgi:hypothetical protein
MEINNIDDFIRLTYPEPNKLDPDYIFFETWGYEQFLIKKYKYDLNGLRILALPDYNKYRMIKMLGKSESIIDALKGLKIVRSKKILRRFLLQSVSKDFPGILLWEENNQYFCMFPSIGGCFGQLIGLFTGGSFPDDEIKVTDDVFVNEDILINMIDKSRLHSEFQMENHVCCLPDYGNVFVAKTWSNGYGYIDFSMDYAPANYDEKAKKWIYLKGKKNLIRVWRVDYKNIEDGKILQ